MRWTTPVLLPKYPFSIDHRTGVLSLGSCFAEHIGQRLLHNKFSGRLNPFGILYDPSSLAHAMDLILAQVDPQQDELFEQQGLWRHFAYHSRYAHPEREQAWQLMQDSLSDVRTHAPQARVVLLTLGTAHAHRLHRTGQVVANCHKLPQNEFIRVHLSVATCVETLAQRMTAWQDRYPNTRFLLTVSPVRHLRLGLVENQRSKATLLLTCAELARRLPWVHYFPAYEIMIDELRDYRFYTDDYLHPTTQAIDYMWEKFGESFFVASTLTLLTRLAELHQAVAHQSRYPGRPESVAFARKQLQKIDLLKKEFSYLDLSRETIHFKSLC